MPGLPIQEWSSLIAAINRLRVDEVNTVDEKIYKYTWDNFKVSVKANIPTLIVNLPEENQYEIIINNKSYNSISLYLGTDGAEQLKVDNSAWEIGVGRGMIIETSGCVLWAISSAESDIIVTIHSTKPNPEKQLAIALNVELKIGTGALLGKHTPLSRFASIYSDWEQILRNTVDSDQGITGFKAAYLKTWQPGQTYEFQVKIAETFTDFSPVKLKPIEVFLIDSNWVHHTEAATVAAMRGLATNELSEFVPTMIGMLKDDSFVTNLPSSGGSFQITPGNSEQYLHFSAHTLTSTEGCVITHFDRATNTFTLGGY